jgi:hypothetical protein
LDNRVQVVFSNAEGADITQSGKIIRAPFAREGSRASKGEWHRDALLKFDVVKSKHLSLGVTGGFYDEQTTLYDGGRLNIGKATGWRKHQAQEGGLTLGILNNQLRYSGQFALSTSQEQSASDGSVVSDSGHGFEQRIDADLWKSETLTLSAYGRYKEAQSAYESSSTWADDAFDLEDSFGFVTGDDKAIGDLEGKGETLGFGGRVAVGDGDLSYSQTDKRHESGAGRFKNEISGTYDWDYAEFSATRKEVLAFDEGERGMLSTTYGGEIGFRADRVLALLDADTGLGALFPNLLRVKVSESTHQDQDDKNARPDSETTIGLGASWEGDMVETEIDVSRTVYDSKNANGSDRTEHFLRVSQEVIGNDWDVFGYAKLSQSREKQQKDKFSDWTFSGGLDFSYEAEDLPDLTLSFGYDWLRQDDESFNYTEESHTWSLGSTLDLDDFVPVLVPGSEPSFGLSLYLQNDRLEDSDSGGTQDWSYYFMFTSGLKF